MRPFPPTLREKRRHIRFKALGFNDDEAVQAITGSMLSLFGEDGYARSAFSIVECEKGVGTCRCTNDWLDNVLVALAFARGTGEKRGRIAVLGVSGTLKKVRKAKGI